MIICENCKKEADLIDVDQGGYEEWWGDQVWHAVFVTVTVCCDSEDWEDVDGDKDTEH
jgi:hypothetical protein